MLEALRPQWPQTTLRLVRLCREHYPSKDTLTNPNRGHGVLEWPNPCYFVTSSTCYWHLTLFPMMESGAHLPQPLTGIVIMTEISCGAAPLAALECQQSISYLSNQYFYLVHFLKFPNVVIIFICHVFFSRSLSTRRKALLSLSCARLLNSLEKQL